MILLLQLLVMIVLFVLSAFFSGSETILFSLTAAQRARIRARNPRADERITRCVTDSAVLLSTLLVGNTLVNFALATMGYQLLSAYFPAWGGVLAVPMMTILLLLLGEITPKRLALLFAESLAPKCACFLLFWRTVLTPFNVLFQIGAKVFAPVLERERRALSDGELVSVLESAAEKGELAQADAEMIEGVLRLSELHANDEMIPRVDMEGFDSDYPDEVRKRLLARAQHRYLPVFRRTPDAIEGIIDRETGKLEEALFVPEQITLDDLLVVFRRSRKPLAIVLDEYGGTAGLIALDDILELIVGPRVFARPESEPRIVAKGKDTWLIDGRASLDEINRELGIELFAEDADRLAGWVAFHAERIVHVGQEIVADGCRATIRCRRGRRVILVELEVLAYPKTNTDAALIAETDEAVKKTEDENR